MKSRTSILAGLGLLLLCASYGSAAEAARPVDPAAVQRLLADSSGGAQVSVNPATGAVRFVRLAPAAEVASMAAARRAGGSVLDRSRGFLAAYGGMFGIADVDTELTVVSTATDRLAATHVTYEQRHRGVPVFAARLKTHFDREGRLRAVNGITVPRLDVRVTPTRSAEEAGRAALLRVSGQGKGTGLAVRGTRLYVYRAGLVKGVPGSNHLAWQVEVGNGGDVREFVFVDAHTGKLVEQFTGVYDALDRRAYNTTANFPATPFWVEGDPFPTADVEADNVILGAGETYDFFGTGFGRDSYDGAGATMHSVFRRTQSCPNASWNSVFTSYCPGVSPDDVVAHEWAHAYTEYTHGLIYAWQPGALNEAYSDIFGEAVDLINGRGTDDPGGVRTDGFCSAFSAVPHVLTVNTPAGIAGDYPAGRALFGPSLDSTGLTGDVVLADDGVGAGVPPDVSTTDGCCDGPAGECTAGQWLNAAEVAGKVALVDRGTCGFVVKVKNAQLQGAVGVIVANHVTGGDALTNMAGVDPTVTIPSIFIGFTSGGLIKDQLPPGPGVNATLRSDAPGIDASYRWLVGEDATAFGGAIRDMWTPICLGSPGKVSDTEYHCAESDGGGVHTNSGVPNHAFALLVDGGTYNGQTVAPLGLVKTVHVYYRAMTVYQVPASDFADHADALEASCADLVGHDLPGPSGLPGDVIGPADCAEVAKAAAAVELRTPPTQCAFQPLLAKDPPDRCEAGTRQVDLFFDSFETNPLGTWTVSHTAVNPEFTPRDWEWVSSLPDRDGSALFGIDFPGGTCAPGGDESGVLHLTSPPIALPAGAAAPRLTFDHWVATEPGWDGGNLKVSANGGPWQVVAPADYAYNPTNASLFTVLEGNTNPMAGEPAFTGADGGSVEGSWGRSHVNLAPYASPGDTVRLRFDIGNDGCAGLFGWYVDDPTVYACVSEEPPSISIGDAVVAEGNAGLTAANLKVTLSHASPEPVSVWYFTWPGTAMPWLDFIPKLAQVTIAPLQLEATVTVQVRGERLPEGHEFFFVLLAAPTGGTVGDGLGGVVIVNDDGGGKH